MTNKKTVKIVKNWFFPKLNISVKAESLEEAEKIVNRKFKS